MRRIISVLISLFILASFVCTAVSAVGDGNTYVFETEDTHYTVVFTGGDDLTEEQERIIAEKLALGSDDGAQTYGLGCTLFGHDYLYKTAKVITHKVRTTSPRCKQDTYEIKYCEDCDYTEETLMSSKYITCCS